MKIKDLMYYFSSDELLEFIDIHDTKHFIILTPRNVLLLDDYESYYLLRIESGKFGDSNIRLYIEKR